MSLLLLKTPHFIKKFENVKDTLEDSSQETNSNTSNY